VFGTRTENNSKIIFINSCTDTKSVETADVPLSVHDNKDNLLFISILLSDISKEYTQTKLSTENIWNVIISL
jgi:hypothetical protein